MMLSPRAWPPPHAEPGAGLAVPGCPSRIAGFAAVVASAGGGSTQAGRWRRAAGMGRSVACHLLFSPRRRKENLLVLITLIVVLLLLALLGGGFGHSRGWGYAGWSPLALLVLIVLVLALTGNLSF